MRAHSMASSSTQPGHDKISEIMSVEVTREPGAARAPTLRQLTETLDGRPNHKPAVIITPRL